MNLIEISVVRGDHQSSNGGPEGRTMETGRRGEASGILRSCIAGQGPRAFRLFGFEIASWLPSKAGAISLRRNLVARKQIRRPRGFKGTRSVAYQAAIERLVFGAITTPHRSPRCGRPKIEGNATMTYF